MGTRRELGADGGGSGGGAGETSGAQDTDRTLLGDLEVALSGRILGAGKRESRRRSEFGALWLQLEASFSGGGTGKTAGGPGNVQAEGHTQGRKRGSRVGKAPWRPVRLAAAGKAVGPLKGHLQRRRHVASPSMNPNFIFHTGSSGRFRVNKPTNLELSESCGTVDIDAP